jgi:hypothetical protein
VSLCSLKTSAVRICKVGSFTLLPPGFFLVVEVRGSVPGPVYVSLPPAGGGASQGGLRSLSSEKGKRMGWEWIPSWNPGTCQHLDSCVKETIVCEVL